MWRTLLRWLGGSEHRSLDYADPALQKLYGDARASSAGESVTYERAVGLTAVWACVNLISGAIATMPLILYRRVGEERERAVEHPLFDVLRIRPNPVQSLVAFWEAMVTALLLRGNAFASLTRDDDGRVRALWFVNPDRVRLDVTRTGGLRYDVFTQGATQSVSADNMLHIPGPLSDDGYSGRSVISSFRETLGLGLAAERYGGEFFSNAATPSGVLQHPAQLSDNAHKVLRESFDERHRQRGRRHGVLVLEEGMQWHPIGINHQDSQFIDQRAFTIQEIARIFSVPVNMISGDLKTSLTYSNAETRALDFLKFCLGPVTFTPRSHAARSEAQRKSPRVAGARPGARLSAGRLVSLGEAFAHAVEVQQAACRSCNKSGGGHYRYCGLLRRRPCRGCGAELGHSTRTRGPSYCRTCRLEQCPECKRYAQQHRPTCRYLQRERRAALTELRDVVSEDDLLDLYLRSGAAAVRLASRVLKVRDAEDLVHDTFVYLLERRRYLRRVPDRAYLFTAVRHAALRDFSRYWGKLVLTANVEDFTEAQRMLAADEPEETTRATGAETSSSTFSRRRRHADRAYVTITATISTPPIPGTSPRRPMMRPRVYVLASDGKRALVPERDQLLLTVALQAAGAPLTRDRLTTLTLTLHAEDPASTIIAGLDHANVLNTGRGSVDAAGVVTLTLNGADHSIIDTSQLEEWHVALLEWTYDGGTARGAQELVFRVRNLARLP